MDSQIEWKRRAHEEIDRLESCVVDLFLANPEAGNLTTPARSKAFKQKLLVEHQIATLQDQMSTTAASLSKAYEKKDEDTEYLRIDGTDLGSFYTELKAIKDHHRRVPHATSSVDSVIEIESILERARVSITNLSTIFTGEERNGRFLDLYQVYSEAVNLRSETFDYLTFLDAFDRPSEFFPESKRSTHAYSAYLDGLLGYLKDFVSRTRPISGFNDDLSGENELSSKHEKELAELVVSLKNNVALELFCGPCDKLFTNASVYEAHLTGKKHIKAQDSFKDRQSNPQEQNHEEAREKLFEQRIQDLKGRQEIERKEFLIGRYGELLKDLKMATKGNIERKQALTTEERILADEESEQEQEEEEHCDELPSLEDDRIYNPLKLPLDWDGKPIPFWLWKLHGLGVPFSCEICGNFVYMGRRAFDQHFYEWRHNHGMKCLGIPNTSHFFQITKIEDVRRLWDKMRVTAKNEALRADWMEECEDSGGNVYDRRTFEDLKRQGLL